MKISSTLLIVAAAFFGLTGCATLSKQECMTGNWQAIGFADGAAGRTADYLNNHNKACAKVGVAADYKAWEQGRKEGLKQYCSESNAYQIGRRGSQMSPVCPANVTAKLERINADGRQYYSLNKQLGIEQERLKKYQDDFDKLRRGDNLNFTSEKEARSYLIELPAKASKVSERIKNLEQALEQLQIKYGY